MFEAVAAAVSPSNQQRAVLHLFFFLAARLQRSAALLERWNFPFLADIDSGVDKYGSTLPLFISIDFIVSLIPAFGLPVDHFPNAELQTCHEAAFEILMRRCR